jgi:hypothetical protein
MRHQPEHGQVLLHCCTRRKAFAPSPQRRQRSGVGQFIGCGRGVVRSLPRLFLYAAMLLR